MSHFFLPYSALFGFSCLPWLSLSAFVPLPWYPAWWPGPDFVCVGFAWLVRFPSANVAMRSSKNSMCEKKFALWAWIWFLYGICENEMKFALQRLANLEMMVNWTRVWTIQETLSFSRMIDLNFFLKLSNFSFSWSWSEPSDAVWTVKCVQISNVSSILVPFGFGISAMKTIRHC